MERYPSVDPYRLTTPKVSYLMCRSLTKSYTKATRGRVKHSLQGSKPMWFPSRRATTHHGEVVLWWDLWSDDSSPKVATLYLLSWLLLCSIFHLSRSTWMREHSRGRLRNRTRSGCIPCEVTGCPKIMGIFCRLFSDAEQMHDPLQEAGPPQSYPRRSSS